MRGKGSEPNKVLQVGGLDDLAEVIGTTDDARTEIRCKACGFQWLHGPSPEDLRAGRKGGSKHHCPVCSFIYTDAATPIVTIGSPSKTGHRCDKTKCFAMAQTYGTSQQALDRRLAQLSEEALAGWPRVLELKRERATRA